MELKPCPFCGSDDVHLTTNRTVGDVAYRSVICMNCYCYSRECLSDEEATEYWNRRAAPEPDLTVGPEPAQGDRERARVLATKDCPACSGRGETYPLCPSCDDSTEDHDCPDPVKCKVCGESGEIIDEQLRDRLAAEFAKVRAEERERCARVADKRSRDNLEKVDAKDCTTAKTAHAWAAQELALLRDAIRKGE